jgi:hypothetical protein
MLLLLSQMTAFAAGTCAPGVAALTPNDAWPTVQAAIDASVGAEPVVVCPGRWIESLTANPDGYLTLVGATGRAQDVVLVTNSDYGIYLAGGRDASIEDMTLTTDPAMALPASALVFAWECDSLTLEDVRIVGATAASLVESYSDVALAGVRVRRNTATNGVITSWEATIDVRDSAFVGNEGSPAGSGSLLGTMWAPLDVSRTRFGENRGFYSAVSSGDGGQLELIDLDSQELPGDLIFMASRGTPIVMTDIDARFNVVDGRMLAVYTSDAESTVARGLRFHDNAAFSSMILVDLRDVASVVFDDMVLRNNTTAGALVESQSSSTDVTGELPMVRFVGGGWAHNTAARGPLQTMFSGWDADLGRDVHAARFELDGVDVGGAADNRFGRRAPGCRSPLPVGVVSWVWDDRTREYCTPP